MNILNETLINLNKYLSVLSAPPSHLEYGATVIVPIISCFCLVIGGAFALYKYISSKNYDINLRILNEVYVPLYAYLVKQETFRYIAFEDTNSYKDSPILEISSSTHKKILSEAGFSLTEETKTVCGCSKEAFDTISDLTNLGLASPELVTLLNMYKILNYLTSGNQNTKERSKALILQNKVELSLRKEIIKGYQYYHKKLKLKNSSSDIYKLSDEQIHILPSITEQEIEDQTNRYCSNGN